MEVGLTKNNITHLVNAYKWAFPSEYQATIIQVKKNRNLNSKATGDFSKLGADALERPIHEIPETLFNILYQRLNDTERDWFGSNKGAEWFAKTFPEFSRVEKV